MLLPGVLFVLFFTGCWLYCLTDAALTPAHEYRGWPKAAWVTLIALTFIVGAVAWMIARRARRTRHWPPTAVGYVTDSGTITWYPYHPAAGSHHAEFGYPAPVSDPDRADRPGRNLPKGPDDDPEFLAQLARRINGTPKDPTE